MTDIYRQLDRDLEDGLRIRSILHDIERRMAARRPATMAAASYDTEPASTSVAWCIQHDQEVATCRRSKRPCKGVPDPKHTDRTGNRVVHDVMLDAFEFEDAAAMLHVAVNRMAVVARRYGKDDPTPEDLDNAVTVEQVNQPKCQNHLRHGYEVDARYKEPTRVTHKGVPLLPSPLRLCRFCIDHLTGTHTATGKAELPAVGDIRRHATRTGLTAVQLPPTRPVHVDQDHGVAHASYA